MDIRLEDVWEDYGLDGLQENLDKLFPEYNLSLNQILDGLFKGDLTGTVEYVFKGTIGVLLQQMAGLKELFMMLLLLGIAATVLTHFVEIFDRHQIADLAYYFMYLLFMMVLFRCFEQTGHVAEQVLTDIVLFIKLLIPTYLLAVGVVTGITTAGAYSQVFALVVYGTECLLSGWIYNLISVYTMLTMVNGIWMEEKLKLLIGFVHRIIVVALKGALGIVTGISIFQNLITPVLDTAQNTLLHKVVTSIPGVGDLSGGVMQLVLGSAVVIKNSIGVMLLLLMIMLCLGPLIKIAAIGWILRLAAALLGMVSDKRLVQCTNHMGESCMLMFRLVGTALLLFVILISLIATGTNHML
ncbi:MAG: stage III sporulation protein AE [Lachnospiraceae bacterium]|nr:stage III sporulation protein AE [Lachnospiraceae bacterium]